MIDERILQFDFEWRQGDRNKAFDVAKSFIDDYRNVLEPVLGKYTLEELVHEIDMLRILGGSREHDRIITDMWILSEFPLQSISGYADIIVKIPDTYARSKIDGNL